MRPSGHPLRAWRTAIPWALAAGLVALTGLPEAWQQAGALRPEGVAAGQWWRLWSAHLVHFGRVHALWDALALGLLLGLARRAAPLARLVAVGLGLVAPLLSLAVLGLEPSLREYRGASGLVVALLAWTGVDLWLRRAVGRRWLLAGAVLLLAKLAWEAWPGRVTASAVLPPGVAVAWSVHLAGALLGAGIRTVMGPRTR